MVFILFQLVVGSDLVFIYLFLSNICEQGIYSTLIFSPEPLPPCLVCPDAHTALDTTLLHSLINSPTLLFTK